jgi:energy-coupling factor transporter ATP-binding protein EcfA2
MLRITRQVGAAAKDSSRVEVPFSTVVPRPEQRWTSSSADSIRVPIGRAGANRLQYLALGEGTCQHALVAGKTGSGKSSLLNAMIVNSALWHSPSELELWLIDFKKGVEFKAYATAGMPHVRVVAVESDREFGLSVLQGLDDELRRRGELFRSAGVQSISDWRALGRGEHMPRSLLVVDEFQELFIEDDKVAQDSALLLDRLVRQGRAFGMHAVLGSQTLGGAYGIARSTMGQMGVRIALQCAEADSQLILSDDNLAARLLSRPGEAIYNDAGGRLEGNNPFQVVWLPDDVRTACLREIAAGPGLPAGRPGPIVFEGNLPADPDTNAGLSHALAGTAEAGPGPRLWLGDPVSIKDPTAAVLPRRSGSNLVVVGQSEETGPALLAMSMIALAAQHPPGSMAMTVLEGLGAPGSPDAPLARAAAAIPAIPAPVMVLGPRSADDALLAFGQELARRLEPGAPAEAPHFLVIDGLHRFRSLRRNENDFSFDDSGPKTPDRILALLLKEGPAVGMHVLAWVDTVANLQRAFDRTTLREINWKVLFQMSANDSSTIIDSPAASRLGPHRAILSDDDAGILEKFRPYPMPDAARLARFADALRRRGS